MLLQKKVLTTHEILTGVQDAGATDNSLQDIRDKISNEARIIEFLNRFLDHKWLKKNDRNYWELAPRAFLELSTYFQVCSDIRTKCLFPIQCCVAIV